MVKEPTEEQSKILQQKGNIVITAKPGSGKTYTIVEKIARVIPDLPEYKGVIAISFTNKASDELKRRCKQRCADGTARFRRKKNDYIFAEPSSFLSKPGLAERRKDVRWEM